MNKVSVSTFYIITFMNCSLVCWRSMIRSWVNTRTQTNKPWNWSTCWCVESLFSKTLQGHQLKPCEQHRFQSDKTPMCFPVPHWPGPCLMGFHWQHNELPQLGSTWGGILYFQREYIDWLPIASHCLGRQWNPHFYIHRHKSLLFHGALIIIWDQLIDRNCNSLCSWHLFKLIKLQWEILQSLHITWEMVILHCLSTFKSFENWKFYIIIPSQDKFMQVRYW